MLFDGPASVGDKPPAAAKPAASSTTKKAAAPKDTTAAKTPPPKKPAAPRRRKSTPKGGRPSKDQFRKLCAELIDQMVGLMILVGFTNPRLAYDAQVIQDHTEQLTDELFARGWDAKTGRANRFGQWIERAGTVGEWGRTLSLVIGIGLPLAANHGLIPTESVALVNLTRSDPLPMPEPVERKPKDPKPPKGARRPDVDFAGLDVDGQGDEAAEVTDRLGWPATG